MLRVAVADPVRSDFVARFNAFDRAVGPALDRPAADASLREDCLLGIVDAPD